MFGLRWTQRRPGTGEEGRPTPQHHRASRGRAAARRAPCHDSACCTGWPGIISDIASRKTGDRRHQAQPEAAASCRAARDSAPPRRPAARSARGPCRTAGRRRAAARGSRDASDRCRCVPAAAGAAAERWPCVAPRAEAPWPCRPRAGARPAEDAFRVRREALAAAVAAEEPGPAGVRDGALRARGLDGHPTDGVRLGSRIGFGHLSRLADPRRRDDRARTQPRHRQRARAALSMLFSSRRPC